MSAATARPDHAREIRYALTDAFSLCERLGLLAGTGTFKRQAGGVIVRCPAHEERTPSCSVRTGPDGTVAWKCHGCQAGGDALSLVATVHGLSTRSDFRKVLALAAEIAGLHDVVAEIEGAKPRERRTPPPPPKPAAERQYPAMDDVDAVWLATKPVDTEDTAIEYLVSRALDPDLIAADDLVRVLPVSARLPWWASFQRQPWTATGHRLIVPMLDADGNRRSVRACRITDGETPKRLPPAGHKATGLVMACPIGIAMLRGLAAPTEVVIVEGEPDWLTWSTQRTSAITARIGIVSGSWSIEFARRCPQDAIVWIRTDQDAAGDRYAECIRKSFLAHGCFVRRGGVAA